MRQIVTLYKLTETQVATVDGTIKFREIAKLNLKAGEQVPPSELCRVIDVPVHAYNDERGVRLVAMEPETYDLLSSACDIQIVQERDSLKSRLWRLQNRLEEEKVAYRSEVKTSQGYREQVYKLQKQVDYAMASREQFCKQPWWKRMWLALRKDVA
jgi:hypothetical protein